MTQKMDPRHPGEKAAFPQYQVGMQVADDSLLNLAQPLAHRRFLSQERQRGRIVAKQEDPLLGLQRPERVANVPQVV